MVHHLAHDLDRAADYLEDAVRRRDGVELAAALVEQEDELVPAEARHEVVLTDARAQAVGHLRNSRRRWRGPGSRS